MLQPLWNTLTLPGTGAELLPSFLLPAEEGRDHRFSCLVLGRGTRADQLLPGQDTLGSSGLEEEGSLRRGTAPRAREGTKRSPVLAQAQPCLPPSSPIQALSPPSSSSALQSHKALSGSEVVTKCHFPQGNGDTLCTIEEDGVAQLDLEGPSGQLMHDHVRLAQDQSPAKPSSQEP